MSPMRYSVNPIWHVHYSSKDQLIGFLGRDRGKRFQRPGDGRVVGPQIIGILVDGWPETRSADGWTAYGWSADGRYAGVRLMDPGMVGWSVRRWSAA